MNDSREFRWHPTAVTCVLVFAVLGFAYWWTVRSMQVDVATDSRPQGKGSQQQAVTITPLPVFPESPFLNTRSDAAYVGSDRCIDCHTEVAAAYRTTGMGQSLARLDSASEPGDAAFDHPASGHIYRVYRRNGEMRHQEVLSTASAGDATDEHVVMADHAIDWVIGSGRHSRSYLLEIDGFLVESPITWYSKRQAWDMSPGYDSRQHHGFSRPVDGGCLICHAGRAEAVAGSIQRMQIHEGWISCERCHGPGLLHAERHAAGATEPPDLHSLKGVDRTIVNQRHLDRELSESICAQCHLRSAATAIGRGQRRGSFRPGVSLSLFRTDYRIGSNQTEMTVVGHVDQLWQSRCWQSSQLTCTTCHNPHAFPDEQVRVSYYRAICRKCHANETCKVDTGLRQRESPENDCVMCHMPSSETEIPHLVFTDHRIGVQGVEPPPRHSVSDEPGTLVAITDTDSWSDLDKRRMLGLAYLEFSGSKRGQRHAETHRQRAFTLLSEVWNRGIRDSDVASALAALTTSADDPGAGVFADAILDDPDSSPEARINGLLARALVHADVNDFDAATKLMKELVNRRRVASDWELLAEFQNGSGEHREGVQSLEQALEITPANHDLRDWLIDYYERDGNTERAEWHRQRQVSPQISVQDVSPRSD